MTASFLFDVIIPSFINHPKIGFDFLVQRVNSIEELRRVENIQRLLERGASIRQYNDQNYIILYHLKNRTVTLLAIKISNN